MSVILVFCTCPDAASAERIGRHLVTAQVAACVSLLPGVQSIFRWDGRIEAVSEVQLLIKTTDARFEALRDAVISLHPYELPELIAVEAAAGLERYLAWVGESVRPDPTS